MICASSSEAYVNGKTTFQWQANPPQDEVIGYRLYYGTKSRFNSNGTLKSNFSYDYYIDLEESMRCSNNSYDNDCEYLAQNELSCVNLDSGTPKCTLSNIKGTLHLAMTAYNYSTESTYTQELLISPKSQQNPSAVKFLPAIELLLKN